MIRFAENLNKMITAGLGGAMEAPSTEVAVGHQVRYIDASGPVATFETNVAAPIRSLRIDMQPVQEGSGDPSPDNVRPISGRDSVTVTRTGKNLFDPSAATVGVNWNGNALAYSIASDYIPVVVGETYTLSVSDMPKFTGVVVAYLDADKVYKTNTANMTFTVPADMAFVRISFRCASGQSWTDSDLSAAKIQLEKGSTATDYEPFDGQSVTVQLGQTVYGGNAEIISGQGESTMAMVDLGTLNWTYQSGQGRFFSTGIQNMIKAPGANNQVINAICSAYQYMSLDNLGTTAVVYGCAVSTTRNLYIKDPNYTDTESFKTAMSGIQFCYELAQPSAFTFAPASLSTLRGENSVRSDAGDVTLKYPYYEETEGY